MKAFRLAMAGMALVLSMLGAPAWSAAWQPAQTDAFDAQLSVPYNTARPVKVMMLDVFEASPARLQELKSRGVHTICAINAGAWENWRPDSGAFDLRLVGSNDAGWQGERYLDIRAQDALPADSRPAPRPLQEQGLRCRRLRRYRRLCPPERIPADRQGSAGVRSVAG